MLVKIWETLITVLLFTFCPLVWWRMASNSRLSEVVSIVWGMGMVLFMVWSFVLMLLSIWRG
jgi:hypothetical protein